MTPSPQPRRLPAWEDMPTHCPACGASMPNEVDARCPTPDCDYTIPEPEPYAVTYWQ